MSRRLILLACAYVSVSSMTGCAALDETRRLVTVEMPIGPVTVRTIPVPVERARPAACGRPVREPPRESAERILTAPDAARAWVLGLVDDYAALRREACR